MNGYYRQRILSGLRKTKSSDTSLHLTRTHFAWEFVDETKSLECSSTWSRSLYSFTIYNQCRKALDVCRVNAVTVKLCGKFTSAMRMGSGIIMAYFSGNGISIWSCLLSGRRTVLKCCIVSLSLIEQIGMLLFMAISSKIVWQDRI